MKTNKQIFLAQMILLLCMLIFSLVACEQGGTPASSGAKTPTQDARKIHVYGDDMSAGTGVTKSYVDIVKDNAHLEVVNHAYKQADMGGAVSVLNNILHLSDLDDVKTNDIVIIFAGYNEMRWYGSSSVSINSTFTPFLTRAYNSGADVYVLNVPKMNPAAYSLFAPLNNGTDAGMLNYSNQIKAVTLNFSRAKFVDIRAIFNPIAQNLQANLEYPNDQGHQIIADLLISAMNN